MSCLECEIVRAKLLAYFWLVAGESIEQVAKKLSDKYSARYFVDEKGFLYRATITPPYSRFIL